MSKPADEMKETIEEILKNNHGSLDEFEIELIRIGSGATGILIVKPESLLTKKDYDDIERSTLNNGDVIREDPEGDTDGAVEFTNVES